MKVEAEVKIKILDGEEKGKVDTFRSIGETETQYTEYGIIERLSLEWRHIHNVSSWGEPCEKETIKVGDEVIAKLPSRKDPFKAVVIKIDKSATLYQFSILDREGYTFWVSKEYVVKTGKTYPIMDMLAEFNCDSSMEDKE